MTIHQSLDNSKLDMMATVRSWFICCRRYKTMLTIIAVVVVMYITLNVWSVVKMNSEIREQSDILPDEPEYMDINVIDPDEPGDITTGIDPDVPADVKAVAKGHRFKALADLRVEAKLDPIGNKNLVAPDNGKAIEEESEEENNFNSKALDDKVDKGDDLLENFDNSDIGIKIKNKNKKRGHVQRNKDMDERLQMSENVPETGGKKDDKLKDGNLAGNNAPVIEQRKMIIQRGDQVNEDVSLPDIAENKDVEDKDEKFVDVVPDVNEAVPDVNEDVPDVNNNVYGDHINEDVSIPDIAHNRDVEDKDERFVDVVPDETDDVPDVKDDVHDVKDGVPDVKDDVPDVKDDVHDVKDGVPDVKDDVHDVKDDVPDVKDDGPEDNNNIPKDNNNIPKNDDVIPKDDDVIPNIDDVTDKEAVNEYTDEEEPFMVILERDRQSDTFEVDLSNVVPSVNVTFPPFVNQAPPDGPGENGKPFKFGPGELSPQEIRQKGEDYNIHYFDLWVTRKISVHRRLPDARIPECLNKTYDFEFPTISVIMVFFNEEWTTLLRSIYSILDRSPHGVITEIILLDDCSNLDHLKEPLEVFLKPMKNIRLIRATKRLGLIKARNLGFMYAKGEIMIFLDSHIECYEGWLEPLIQPIVEDESVVTMPVICGISKENFGSIMSGTGLFLGGLKILSLAFIWIQRHWDGCLYCDSPTMPGGLYAISRKRFRHLGAYDPDLHLWGGENVEISLKIWMCGGAIRQAKCSNVGHVFRTQSPVAKEHSAESNLRNSVRVAEVWLQKYKHFYYEKTAYRLPDYGNVTDRQNLRERLQCRDFKWYLDTVNPELKAMMDVKGVYAGAITNQQRGSCLSFGAFTGVLTKCDPNDSRQVWLLTTKGHLTVYDKVLAMKADHDMTSGNTFRLMSYNINAKTSIGHYVRWRYDKKKRLNRLGTKHCLDLDGLNKLVLEPCGNRLTQKWSVQTRQELQDFHKKRLDLVPIDWSV